MTTIANLELLKEAFIWEQKRDAGLDKPNCRISPVQQNAMKKRLNDAWIAYFQGLKCTDQRRDHWHLHSGDRPSGGDINEEQAGNMIIN